VGVDAYARAVQDFLIYCDHNGIKAQQASRDEVARYVGDLRRRPSPQGKNVLRLDSGVGLSNATLQQRLTAVRLLYGQVETGQVDDHQCTASAVGSSIS